jgi:hypothetical protein
LASWQITPRVLAEALAAGGDEAKRAFGADEEDRRRRDRGGGWHCHVGPMPKCLNHQILRGKNPWDPMSALGQKQTSDCRLLMSAIPPKAAIAERQLDVRFVHMIDAVLNIAVFAALVLCIVGFSAWARKRVP